MKYIPVLVIAGLLGWASIRDLVAAPPNIKPTGPKVSAMRVQGMKDAVADIEAGEMKWKSNPLPSPPWHGRYIKILKEECGIKWENVEDTSKESRDNMGGYNDVIQAEVEHRFGRDVRTRLHERAKKEYSENSKR
jgi:hypothetical protein